MLRVRLIPILLLKHGLLVRSENFRLHQIIGNPYNEVKRFNQWNVDELVYLDISREDSYDMRRSDHKEKSAADPLEILATVSKTCFMPLTWGGKIRTVEDMSARLQRGADKIVINSEAVRRPELITEGAATFGSQAIVVSVDVAHDVDGRPVVHIDGGRIPTGLHAVSWAKEAEARGAGEILLQSIERDGQGLGYDTDLIKAVAGETSVPVVACSGVGRYEDYVAGVQAGAAAVAAANIWHFKEMSDRGGKRALAKAGIPVRL